MNEKLLKENADLRNQLAANNNIDTLQDVVKTIPIYEVDSSKYTRSEDDSLNIVDTNLAKTDSLKNKVDSTIKKIDEPKLIRYASYHYIPARVINNSIANDRMNHITINRGSKAGIQKNMAVVTNDGIVGRVVNVTENYATVLSVLSEGRVYNARLEDGSEFFISWLKGTDNAVVMEKVPKMFKVQKGDKVYTTGYSIFPENIMIGKIAKVDTSKKNNTKTLTILLNTNFRKLQYVYVVKDDLSKEKNELEQKTKDQAKTEEN